MRVLQSRAEGFIKSASRIGVITKHLRYVVTFFIIPASQETLHLHVCLLMPFLLDKDVNNLT